MMCRIIELSRPADQLPAAGGSVESLTWLGALTE
jgi:hypothetical protein